MIYRFRKFCDYNIKYLKSNIISGALAKVMEDEKEMSPCIDKSKFISKMSSDDIKRLPELEQSLHNHCINNYYIASFTLESPESNFEMWEKYANNGMGFCLAYNEIKIKTAINFARLIKNKNSKNYYRFDKCTYDKEKGIDISNYIFDILDIIKKHKSEDERQDAIDKKIKEQCWDSIINTMFRKIGTFIEKNEMRLVMLKLSKKDKNYANLLNNIKPEEIIISNLLNKHDIDLLIKIGEDHNIKTRVINLKHIGQ